MPPNARIYELLAFARAVKKIVSGQEIVIVLFREHRRHERRKMELFSNSNLKFEFIRKSLEERI